MSQAWPLPRTLMQGTKGMRNAGELYLPKEPGESQDAYRNRLSRSVLFNAFKRTVKGITGKAFSKDVVLGEDVNSKIVEWSEDIDLSGRNMSGFAKEVFKDGVQVGISHILVDMPSGEAAKTLADEKELNRRPYFVHIRAEDLISWKVEVINGKKTLVQIRFKESVTTDDGEYGEKLEERIRVLWRDRYEVWTKKEKQNEKDDQWILSEDGPVSLGEIPLATFYASRTGFMIAEPPLEDLADLNVAHWESGSDQRNILHVARVPLLFGKGLTVVDADGNKIEYGPNRLIQGDESSDLKFVEHSGSAIESGRQDILDLEDRMRVMGLEVFLNKTQTLGEKSIDSENANSDAKVMALGLKDALEQALLFMAKWAKLGDTGGSIDINTNYLGMTAQSSQEISVLLNARKSGEISRETFWSEVKRRGLLADDFDHDEEELRLSNDAMNDLIDEPDEDQKASLAP